MTTVFALGAAAIGFGLALARHRAGTLLAPGLPTFVATLFAKKFYFDELYDRTLANPTVRLARASALADKRNEAEPFQIRSLDGALNSVGDATIAAGGLVRRLQTGRLREYVLALGLTLAVGLGILFRFTR